MPTSGKNIIKFHPRSSAQESKNKEVDRNNRDVIEDTRMDGKGDDNDIIVVSIPSDEATKPKKQTPEPLDRDQIEAQLDEVLKNRILDRPEITLTPEEIRHNKQETEEEKEQKKKETIATQQRLKDMRRRRCILVSSANQKRKTTWIGAYLKYTEAMEAPQVFHIWSSITVLAAAVSHHVWLDRGHFKLYPNLYTVLVAESAKCRKSTAVETPTFNFFDKLTTGNLLTGTFTSAGIYDALDPEKGFSKNGRKITPDGGIFLLASELTYSLHDENERKRVLEFLTANYGYQPRSHDITRGGGRREVENVCINLLGATTPVGIAEVISNSIIGKGMIGRTIWIHADKARKKEAWLKKTVEMEKIEKLLLHDIKIIGTLVGAFKVTKDAEVFYEEWYNFKLKSSDDARTTYEKEYLERKGTLVLKVGMIIAIDESNELILERRHLAKAIELLEMIEEDMWKVFRLVGTDTNALATDILLFLAKKPLQCATVSHLTAYFRARIRRQQDLKQALDLLEEEELIYQRTPGKKKKIYQLTKQGRKYVFGDKDLEEVANMNNPASPTSPTSPENSGTITTSANIIRTGIDKRSEEA